MNIWLRHSDLCSHEQFFFGEEVEVVSVGRFLDLCAEGVREKDDAGIGDISLTLKVKWIW